MGAFLGAFSQYIIDIISNLINSKNHCGKITSDIFKISGSWQDYVSSIIDWAVDFALSYKKVGNVIKAIIEALVDQIRSFLDGNGFSIVQFCHDFINNYIFDEICDRIKDKIKPKKCKEYYKVLREKYGIKGTNAYEQHWKKVCERIDKIFNSGIVFVDALEEASGSFVDFVRELCKGTFIEAMVSI